MKPASPPKRRAGSRARLPQVPPRDLDVGVLGQLATAQLSFGDKFEASSLEGIGLDAPFWRHRAVDEPAEDVTWYADNALVFTDTDTDALDDADHRRMTETITFITNIEHAGDIVERSLMPLAAKRIKRGILSSDTSSREIRGMIERIISNARAAAVFMTEDSRSARRLLRKKEVFREFEMNATEAHFGRVRGGRQDSVEAARLHLDIVQDLKRVNSHLAAAAYPILEGQGELLPSRLRQVG
jgi:phosphate:Na+ symporter